MGTRVNPFHELYVTETIRPGDFVDVFSPLLVSAAMELFQPGNVVLTGVQGSGKSMLFALLKPQIQIAYRRAERQFPVPDEFNHFIGAGINLTRSGAIDFGQRPIDEGARDEPERFAAYFADFLNCWLVLDLLSSVRTLASSDGSGIAVEFGLEVSDSAMDAFAAKLAKKPCWSGFFGNVRKYDAFVRLLEQRIGAYRDYLNYNTDALPDAIRRTKTSAGEPVSVTAETLRATGIVPGTIPFFIRIDQYEELSRLEDWSKEKGLYQNYRTVIYKMLGTRDPRVSYRIGTRRHAWPDRPRMHGTTGIIEELRNYHRVDMEELFRRKENRPWGFAKFAEDVFERRLIHARFVAPKGKSSLLRQVLGRVMSPQKKAWAYARNKPANVVQVEPDWPAFVQECLVKLALANPLSAKLGEAWVRQQMERDAPVLPSGQDFPWELPARRWWKKERTHQALLQIAARQRQRMIWAGEQDVLALSGSNVLVFVSICQYIWSAWIRSRSDEEDEQNQQGVPAIDDPLVQDEGIQQATVYWYRKIRTDPDGDSRQRFIDVVGTMLCTKLQKDKKMSYPGRNGFSVSNDDLSEDADVARQLRDAAAFGVLFDRPHTPKSRALGRRRKWYLNPVLCPYFQIPVVHTKEPMYVRAKDVRAWLVKAKVLQPASNVRPPRKQRSGESQMRLFDDSSEDEG